MTIEAEIKSDGKITKGVVLQSGISTEYRLPFPGTRNGWRYIPSINNFIEVDEKGLPIPEET